MREFFAVVRAQANWRAAVARRKFREWTEEIKRSSDLRIVEVPAQLLALLPDLQGVPALDFRRARDVNGHAHWKTTIPASESDRSGGRRRLHVFHIDDPSRIAGVEERDHDGPCWCLGLDDHPDSALGYCLAERNYYNIYERVPRVKSSWKFVADPRGSGSHSKTGSGRRAKQVVASEDTTWVESNLLLTFVVRDPDAAQSSRPKELHTQESEHTMLLNDNGPSQDDLIFRELRRKLFVFILGVALLILVVVLAG